MTSNKTMKNLKFLILIISFLWGGSTSFAQYFTAEAIVMLPITLDNTTPLNFGMIVSSATPGTVVYNPRNNTRTRTGGVTLPAGFASMPSIAVFVVSGEKKKGYTILLPNTPVTITRIGGSETMTVTSFVASIGNSLVTTGTLNNQGDGTFNVGATLNVGGNQAPGTYKGTYDVQVVYQ